ncbi:hypothetical protein [Methylobacterium sp. A54F]
MVETPGRPMGVMPSPADLVAVTRIVRTCRSIGPQDRILSVLPAEVPVGAGRATWTGPR